MILLLDIGNTSVKSAVLAQGQLRPAGDFHHRDGDFAEPARNAWHALHPPDKVMVSNVAGRAVGDALSDWCIKQWGIAPEFVRATAKAFGVTNAYTMPSELGADRWAAMVGAHASSGGAACIVDCGTAVTLDFLLANGDHQGGMILPGVVMLERALLNTTADIGFTKQPKFVRQFARRTADAVHGGAIYMVTASIDRIVAEMGEAAGIAPEIIITGGDAETIQPLLASTSRFDPFLVLKGLSKFAGES